MLTFFCFLMLVFILLAIVALRLKTIFWTVAVLALLLLATASPIPLTITLIAWVLFIPIALIANLPFFWASIVVKPIFNVLKNNLPTISETERQTIEAGDTWWEKSLFSGMPDWTLFDAIILPKLSKAEQDFLKGPVDVLCGMLDDWEIIEKHGDLPKEVWQFIKDNQFFALEVDKEWGGLGFSALAHSSVVMKIATRSPSAAVIVMVPNSLGPGELLKRYGTDAQKKHYLPRLATGKEIPCFALTGPEAGSDATAITDRGVVCKAKYQGKEQLCIRLNFDKRYITLAPIATLIGLAFKLYDPDGLLGKKKEVGISLALLPANISGIDISTYHKPMHMVFPNGTLRGKDVLIPLDWIIGGAAMCGRGWEMLMECLAVGRGISLPALSTGNAKLGFCVNSAYAYLRQQFHLPIGKFEGIQEALGRIGGMAYLSEATRLFTISAIDSGLKPALATAITKYHLTEMARQVANDSMDIHGGRAIQRGPRNYLASIYDAMPISITVEGANILTRSLMIFGQGVIRSHPYLQAEIETVHALKSDFAQMKVFNKLLHQHAGFFISNLARALLFGFGATRFIKTPFNNELEKYARKIVRMSTALALASDLALMFLGGDLKRRESVSARLGDVLSYLYMTSALIKYYQAQKESTPQVQFLNWGMDFCFHRIQIALDDFFDNFPQKTVGLIIRRFVFPWGKSYKAVKDDLNHGLANSMMLDNDLREQIKSGCYIKELETEVVGRVELAFKMMLQAEPVLKKLKIAIKENKVSQKDNFMTQLDEARRMSVITQKEKDLLMTAERLRLESLKVDEFKRR